METGLFTDCAVRSRETRDALRVARLYLRRVMPYDCQECIESWLPLRTQSSCRDCGMQLVCANKHGTIFVSDEAQYGYDVCTSCYIWEQT